MHIDRLFASLAILVGIFVCTSKASAHYSPTMGRWLEEDPRGYKGGLNLYQCEVSDPTVYVDPSGLLQTPYPFVSGMGTWSATLGWNDNYSSSMDIWFVPNAKASCRCKLIGFIQYFYEGNGWQIDSTNILGLYVHQTYWIPGKQSAHLWDSPGAAWYDYDYYDPFFQDFETTAVCLGGLDTQKSYGTIKWGHSYTGMTVSRYIENKLKVGARTNIMLSVGYQAPPYE